MSEKSYPFEYKENKSLFVVNINGDLVPDIIHQTFLNIVEDKRGSVRFKNIMWLLQKAKVPKDFTYVDVIEKAQTISFFFPVGLSAIVVDSNSSLQKAVSDYVGNIALMNTQRVVQVFNSVEEAEAWFDSVTHKSTS